MTLSSGRTAVADNVRFPTIADFKNRDSFVQMQVKAAYEAIQRALSNDPRKSVVQSSFDEELFGNFVIGFIADGHPSSLVNDRGQLFLYDGFNAEEYRRMVIDDLSSADEAAVVEAVMA